MLDEGVGGGVTELAPGERVDGDGCIPWSCCESLKKELVDYLL